MKRFFTIKFNFLLFLQFAGTTAILAQTTFPEIGGWTRATEIKVYNSDNLWEYIDGAADYYLNYGFSNLEVREYYRTEEEYIKVEIYDQKNAINAFGIYAYERTPDAEFLEIGEEGYIVHSSLNFYTGNYYVKIFSHQSDTATISAIKLLAAKTLQSIATDKETIDELLLLPVEGKMLHSEKYFPTNFLGYGFFSNAISAGYLIDDKKFSVFVIHAASSQGALNMLQEYFDFSKVSEKASENTTFAIEDFFSGPLRLMVQKDYLFGIVELNDSELEQKILNEISARVQ
jgi:hypothetical protein